MGHGAALCARSAQFPRHGSEVDYATAVMQATRDCEAGATSVLGPDLAARTAPGRPILVEVYLLGCRADGTLAYRLAEGRLDVAEEPDEAAARIGQIPAGRPGPGVTLHSTSWRHLGDGSIVLTYVAAPDPDPGTSAIPIASFEIAHGPHPARPSPPSVLPEQVAAHAARHLALVADVNPQVRRALSADPALRRALAALPRAAAGQLSC